jgi:signal transduction histidine kinase
MLQEFIEVNRQEIIDRCRTKVVGRLIPVVTEAEINHGVPLFLDQLVEVLRLGMPSDPEIVRTALLHGHDLMAQGYTVSQVVRDYGDVCQSITELAVETAAPISLDDFRVLNRCLDDAIAGAVTQFGRERNQAGVDGEAARGRERLGFIAHELRNLVNTGLMAYDAMQRGNVGVTGSTSAVLRRSLVGLETLISSSLAEIRLFEGVQNPERFEIAAFIGEILPAVQLAAEVNGIHLVVAESLDSGIVRADKQVLAAVVVNLLQNAIKFTRPRTTITLRTVVSDDESLIEVEDECGGLPAGDPNDLFRSFEQRGTDRTGLGLGLAFSRWGVEANGGQLRVRSIAEKGCVFTVALPIAPVLTLKP